jgi:hypothetical protein
MKFIEIFLDTFKGGVTFKKVFAFTLLLLVLLVALIIFEYQTGTFELRRLEKTSAILSQLNDLGDPTKLPSELQPIYSELANALAPIPAQIIP